MYNNTQSAGVTPKNIKLTKRDISNTLLIEVAWEVCNQVGGIYTVIRSKSPTQVNKWGNNYCTIGPYIHHFAMTEFEEIENPQDPLFQTVKKMRDLGFDAHYGKWLVTGRPNTVLLNPFSVYDRLGSIKYEMWDHHDISMPGNDDLLNQVTAFGYLVKIFFMHLSSPAMTSKKIIGHFHEWMSGTHIPEIRRENINMSIIFTTHATLLGRYLAMNDPQFYDHLPFFNWADEAKHFNIEPSVKIERAAAHGSHVFTTVSDITGKECEYLVGRKPDFILPNGINIKRFTALHEFQNLHQTYKVKIHQFVMAHFFPSYTFDLDKTIYFFTSGRFEYRNKGFDLTIEALSRLNWKLKQAGDDITIVMFFITRQPYHHINPEVLNSVSLLEELRNSIYTIKEQIGERLFYAAASSKDHRLPPLNEFVEDYWRLRYRRILQSFVKSSLPPIVTHHMVDDAKDPILNFLRSTNLINNQQDKVKVVYHPDFISSTNPLFRMEYDQFVRGSHLGVFPSLYEPWGYTPLESLARAVPAITSNLSGFGDYSLNHLKATNRKAIYIVNNKTQNFDKAANQLANQMLHFARLKRRERIELRYKAENNSVHFDWNNLISYYDKAYLHALSLNK
jgi:glycogen(starch) synthase